MRPAGSYFRRRCGGNSILQGNVYRRKDNMAGEIGHTLIKEDGPECECGKRGCLEAIASESAIVSRARKELGEGKKSIISEGVFSSSR